MTQTRPGLFAVNSERRRHRRPNLPLQKASRIRRLGAANITFDIFESLGCVLIDPIGIVAVEINCGPNSCIPM